MIGSRSFTDYVKERFKTEIYFAIDDFVRDAEADDYESLELRLYKVHQVGNVEVVETEVMKAYAYDMPEMNIGFDIQVRADFEVSEGDYHYDGVESPHQWFLLRCSGDLSKDLEDFQILSIEIYNGRKKQEKALYESLVPVMFAKDYEDIAEQFLRDVYPKALVNNTPPDPRDIASKLGLTVMERSITDDYSIFGQIYFRDTDTELYNKKKEIMEPVHILAKTIVVDPDTYFLYNLGRVNNTIIHECVHW